MWIVKLDVGEVGTEVTVQVDRAGDRDRLSIDRGNEDVQRPQRSAAEHSLTVSGTGDSGLYRYVFLTPTGGQGGGSRFSLGGARGSQNYFNVDGISSNSPAFGNSIGPAEPSFESIQEVRFEIVNNKAEFGEVANITAITKSGTNDLHGALFWYHENAALNARSFFAQTLGQNIRNNFGASMGGPDPAQQAILLRHL